MGLSVVNKLVIDEVNYPFARRIAYVASTGGSWEMRWPFVHAKTRLCSLRKRPQGKMLDPFEIFGVVVPIGFFCKREAKAVSIESRAFLRLSGDWAVTGNKYDFHGCIIAETKMACSRK